MLNALLSEGLHQRLVARFAKILIRAQQIELSHLETLQGRVKGVQLKFEEVNVPKDQDLFAAHNLRSFTPPGDWKFEPSSVHYDTAGVPSTICS